MNACYHRVMPSHSYSNSERIRKQIQALVEQKREQEKIEKQSGNKKTNSPRKPK
jgi:hypothetical protein